MEDLSSFYKGDFKNPGVFNTYLRVLDVYNEISYTRQEFFHPNQKNLKIKIFETDLIDEFEILDEELNDLLEFNLIIVPIFVRSKQYNLIETKYTNFIYC